MEDTHALTIVTSAPLGVAGEIADQAHGGHAFTDYQQRKAANTLLLAQEGIRPLQALSRQRSHCCRRLPLPCATTPTCSRSSRLGLAQPRHATPLCRGRQDRQ